MPWFSKSRAPAGYRSPFNVFFWIAVLGFLGMVVVGTQEIITELHAGRWPTVPCEIQSSGVTEERRSGSSGYIAIVRYTYHWQGRTYFSDRIRLDQELLHSDVADAEARAAKFPKGAHLQCHVNPADPHQAILETRPNFVPLVLSPFLLVIWALYERAAITDWLLRRQQARRGSRQPLTANRALRRRKTKLLAVGGLGLVMDLFFAGFLWLWPWMQLRASRSWQETPCTITRVAVETQTTHQGGRFFKPQVLYQYEFAGELHTSSQLDFSAGMDFNYARVRKLAKAYRAGQVTTCFVNPAQPRDAVLLRRFRADPFFSLFIAGFFGCCLFLLFQSLPGKPGLPTANPWETSAARSAAETGETTLRPEIQPAPRLLACLVGFVACIGIAWWLLLPCWESLRQGGFDLLPLIYGCAAVVGAFFCAKYARRYGRELRHRGPALKLTPAMITPGQPFTVEWEWPREARNPGFRLFLEGVEAVRVMSEIPTQHGASRAEKTRDWVFFTLPLTRGDHPETSAFGQARGQLPALTMHSFEGSKTKIQWRMRAEFPQAGDISRKYKVIVRPPKASL